MSHFWIPHSGVRAARVQFPFIFYTLKQSIFCENNETIQLNCLSLYEKLNLLKKIDKSSISKSSMADSATANKELMPTQSNRFIVKSLIFSRWLPNHPHCNLFDCLKLYPNICAVRDFILCSFDGRMIYFRRITEPENVSTH